MIHKIVIKSMLGLLFVVIIFHLCIITKIIPYEITWGGRLQNDSEMYIFEAISISINLFLVFVLLMKGEYIKFYFKQRFVNMILWIFLILFVLNTIGNSLAKTNFEKSFAVLTLIFSIFIWVILKKETGKRNKNTTETY
ncbi:hypothetical protein AS589_11890 [Empedobacter brevis]|nr:hypothetical protein AS589_11890 [Empedobacter brevis]